MAPVDSLSFQCALLTGGGGGLGKAMAIQLLQRGKKVIIAGRTEKSLAETAKEINATGYYVLDTGDIASIPAFVSKIAKEHPDLDCLINNAGVQRPLEVTCSPGYEGYGFDLDSADQEIDINIRGPVHLTVRLIEDHFSKLENGAVVMNVSSVLGFVPFSVINPVYNGTKSFLHSFTTNIRQQLARQNSKIKVVEIVPPQVESDLHRDRTNPDDNKKKSGAGALSVEEFIEDVKKGWEDNLDTVSAGQGIKMIQLWDETFGTKSKAMAK
ncbi:uncharacterized protein I303_105695 [Kwoniella dejecticola CBS 10117]|uniref:Short-chain dehydrogenase n=1 Tax=Kwoniella dejecticola CBS 10117 TaxID=1296121 RepID=A0A1A6A054_9TREE|nr:uncharacterized protein I303_05716 [Kwoniella dejecticola CBS 10117]OBR83438.1 hypothetical protein I303_05716 [Kwoniella dejecticola CBS 10117]